jgi:hypothetical protein
VDQDNTESAPKPLFGKKAVMDKETWRENAFFQAIETDRVEVNNKMESKYNLNFNNEDNIFLQTAESENEIKSGKRQNVQWVPIQTKSHHLTRWNSMDVNNFNVKPHTISNVLSYDHLRLTTSNIRTIE